MGFTGIVGEVKKGNEVYTFNFEGATDLQAIYHKLLKIATGQDIYEDQEQIIDLHNGEYEHIRVYRAGVKGPVIEEPDHEEERPKVREGLDLFTDHTDFFGQKLFIKGVKGIIEGVPFLMIHRINDQDAVNALNVQNLGALNEAIAEKLRLVGPVLILPHAAGMDDDEALEYVRDYAEELSKAAAEKAELANKTAVAFSDWNKE